MYPAKHITKLFVTLSALCMAAEALAQIDCVGYECTVTARGPGSVSIPLGGRVPALQLFDLSQVDNDRPVHSLAVGAIGDRFIFELSDGDGREEIRGRAIFYDYGRQLPRIRDAYELPANGAYATNRTIHNGSTCFGSCTLVIPRPATAHRQVQNSFLVLSGFRFNYRGRHDYHNIREVRVLPDEDGNIVTTFKDDSDDHGYDVAVTYILVPAPQPWPANPHPLVPVQSEENSDSSDRAIGGGAVNIMRVPGPPEFDRVDLFLKGFRVRYRDSDEHLKRIMVDIHDAPVTVLFHDNDMRETMEFKVDVWQYRVRNR